MRRALRAGTRMKKKNRRASALRTARATRSNRVRCVRHCDARAWRALLRRPT